MTRSTRIWIRRLHLTLALTLGLFISAVSLSGSVLVFGDEIDALLRSQFFPAAAEAGAAHADLDGAVAAAHEALPEGQLRYLHLSQQAESPHTFWFARDDGESVKVFVDPYTSAVLGQADEHAGLIGFLHDLHIHLFMGETGTTVTGVVGLALLVLLGTGLYLWWPGWGKVRAALWVKWSAPLRRKIYDIHRATGAWTAALVGFSVGTGVLLAFYAWSAPVLLAIFGGLAPPAPPDVTPVLSAEPRWQQVVESAQAQLPEATPTWVYFPATPEASAGVRLRHANNPHPNGNSYVHLDPYRNEPLQIHDWRTAGLGQQLADLKYPLHIGHFGPALLVRCVMVIVGLIPALLTATGVWLFWQRTTATKRASTARRDTAVRQPTG